MTVSVNTPSDPSKTVQSTASTWRSRVLKNTTYTVNITATAAKQIQSVKRNGTAVSGLSLPASSLNYSFTVGNSDESLEVSEGTPSSRLYLDQMGTAYENNLINDNTFSVFSTNGRLLLPPITTAAHLRYRMSGAQAAIVVIKDGSGRTFGMQAYFIDYYNETRYYVTENGTQAADAVWGIGYPVSSPRTFEGNGQALIDIFYKADGTVEYYLSSELMYTSLLTKIPPSGSNPLSCEVLGLGYNSVTFTNILFTPYL